MAYIERETALKIIDNYSKTVDADGKVIVKAVRDIVDTICPTADVVEVVHCKNCRHLMFSDCYGECERGYMGIVSPDDYCSRGERKDGEK